MSDMRPATDKQVEYILKLAGCKYLSQVAKITSVSMTNRARQGGLWRSEASDIIDDLLSQQSGEPVTPPDFVVVEYRRWKKCNYSTTGLTPSTTRYFIMGAENDSHIKEVMRESGHLAEEVWRGTDSEAAQRARVSHEGANRLAGAHGHERLMKHLAPQGDVSLLVDITPEHLLAAVRRKPARTGWALEAMQSWAEDEQLGAITGDDTMAAVRALGSGLTPSTTGTEAQELVRRAVAAARAAQGPTASSSTRDCQLTGPRRRPGPNTARSLRALWARGVARPDPCSFHLKPPAPMRSRGVSHWWPGLPT